MLSSVENMKVSSRTYSNYEARIEVCIVDYLPSFQSCLSDSVLSDLDEKNYLHKACCLFTSHIFQPTEDVGFCRWRMSSRELRKFSTNSLTAFLLAICFFQAREGQEQYSLSRCMSARDIQPNPNIPLHENSRKDKKR